MSKRNKSLSGPQIVPLRLPEDMRIKVRELSKKSRLSDADIMRMAIDRGLGSLETLLTIPAAKAA